MDSELRLRFNSGRPAYVRPGMMASRQLMNPFLFSFIGSSMARVIDEKTIQARIIFVKTFKFTFIWLKVLNRGYRSHESGFSWKSWFFYIVYRIFLATIYIKINSYFMTGFSEWIICAKAKKWRGIRHWNCFFFQIQVWQTFWSWATWHFGLTIIITFR